MEDLKREEEKMLQTMNALNGKSQNESELQKKLNEMLVNFQKEEDKLRGSMDTLKADHDAVEKALKKELDALKMKHRDEQDKLKDSLSESSGDHKAKVNEMQSKLEGANQLLAAAQ